MWLQFRSELIRCKTAAEWPETRALEQHQKMKEPALGYPPREVFSRKIRALKSRVSRRGEDEETGTAPKTAAEDGVTKEGTAPP